MKNTILNLNFLIRAGLSLFLLIALTPYCFGQAFVETYYLYNWQPTPGVEDASFYSLSKNTDSGWYRTDYFLNAGRNRIQMTGLFTDKENKVHNGTFRWYYYNGSVKAFGKYENNKKEGNWLGWYSNGALMDSINYRKGEYYGVSKSWYKNGFIKDSVTMDEAGAGTYIGWFDNGNPSEAGKYKNFKKQGKLVFYHKNGNVSSYELYDKDSLTQFQLFDENGVPQDDSAIIDKPAKFANGGEKGWHKYVSGSLVFPGGFNIVNSDHINVVTEATIGENGKVEDAEVIIPFHYAFDKEALRVFNNSPLWEPAMNHNRKVKYTFTFRVSFAIEYH